GGMVAPIHIYNAFKEICKIIEKDVELFCQDPGKDAKMPEQSGPEDKKAQLEMMKLQADGQMRQQEMMGKAQIEKLQADADITTQDRKTQAEIALAERKFQFDAGIAQQKFEL